MSISSVSNSGFNNPDFSSSSPSNCTGFAPGHNIHWIHGRRLQGWEHWADVDVTADPQLDLIYLVIDGQQQLMWFHNVGAVATALEAAVDTPQWCQRYSTLMVPGGFGSEARSSFFYLARPERVLPCNGSPVRAPESERLEKPGS
ncbi:MULTISPECIES: hypothetical protein [unclassified Arthrobacter]|uniref:hypothetical protein n=1 Tax=unclassified Arthrobacter TaxID=235627 RepID=UPI001E293FEB|nr:MULTISPECIES: hypothetical protein [unclassified Arthrobacter]MCC9176495.1 hypothetical protein [Arthrobacter sp. zg-Y750]MDK1326801.1 hypothetical protein [Arthrobacter sp. zg-Y1143]